MEENTKGNSKTGRAKWKPGDLVLNLSKRDLTGHEEEVLKKGIKFCPYPEKINTFQYMKDLKAFNRRMRLKEYFVDSKERDMQPEWMKNNKKQSVFTPPRNRETNLDSYLDMINSETMDLLKINSDKHWENLTEHEKLALEKLRRDKGLIIKPADKGGALTVMDTPGYEEGILKMLSDGKFYKQVENDLNHEFKKEVNNVIKVMNAFGHITAEEAEYLTPNEPKTPVILWSPKGP